MKYFGECFGGPCDGELWVKASPSFPVAMIWSGIGEPLRITDGRYRWEPLDGQRPADQGNDGHGRWVFEG